MKIDNNIVEILRESRIINDSLYLDNPLERSVYLKVNKILESIGGEWNKKLKCHVFKTDIEDILSEIIDSGEFEPVPDKKKLFNFFPTPQKLAARLVEMAEISPRDYVLEPSAGQGAIFAEILKKSDNAIFVELDRANYDICCAKFTQMGHLYDFLKYLPPSNYDRIIMNPPFNIKGHSQCDISHVYHAFNILKEKGILVSVVSESPFFRTNTKSVAFRAFLKDNNAEIIKLDSGAFKESGTMVNTRIIKIKKT